MEYLVTIHAVEQFMRRWCDEGRSFESAQSELISLLSTSGYAGKTRAGDQIVQSGFRPEIRMVIKDRNVCVTVLPNHVNAEQIYLDEMEELEFAKQQEYAELRKQIEAINLDVARIDEARHKLGIKKTALVNDAKILQNKIQKIKYYLDDLVVQN